MPSRKGRKNKRTLAREARALTSSTLDSLGVMERAMRFFEGLAARDERLIEEEMAAATPDPRRISDLENSAGKHHANAAAMAEKVTPYRYPKLSAIKIAQPPEDDLEGKTLDQLREEIVASMERLGLFENVPLGIANRTEAIGENGRSEASAGESRTDSIAPMMRTRLPRPRTT